MHLSWIAYRRDTLHCTAVFTACQGQRSHGALEDVLDTDASVQVGSEEPDLLIPSSTFCFLLPFLGDLFCLDLARCSCVVQMHLDAAFWLQKQLNCLDKIP